MLNFASTLPGFPVGWGREDGTIPHAGHGHLALLAWHRTRGQVQSRLLRLHSSLPPRPATTMVVACVAGSRGTREAERLVERLGLRSPGEGQGGTQGLRSDASMTTGCCFRDHELRDLRAVPDHAALRPPSVCMVGVPTSKQRNPELRAHHSLLQTAHSRPPNSHIETQPPCHRSEAGPWEVTEQESSPASGRYRKDRHRKPGSHLAVTNLPVPRPWAPSPQTRSGPAVGGIYSVAAKCAEAGDLAAPTFQEHQWA